MGLRGGRKVGVLRRQPGCGRVEVEWGDLEVLLSIIARRIGDDWKIDHHQVSKLN